ncbi:MAG: S49 family peptidase [Glycocaulis sp.]
MILPPRLRAAMAAPVFVMPEFSAAIEAGLAARPGLDLGGFLRRTRSAPAELSASGKPLAAWFPPPGNARNVGWTSDYEARLADNVALIDVQGLLSDRAGWNREAQCWCDGYDEILASARAALAHENVHGVFLRIDSPGGVSFGLFEAVEEIAALPARHGGKPFVCHVQGFGASAAYALAAACDEVHAAPSARIGSIGAIQLHHDVSGAMEKAGIKVTAVTFGDRKPDGSPFGPLSETALANWQAHIGDCGTRFVAAVARLRGLPEADILAQEAELYSADNADPAYSALKRGLIDLVADEPTAFARARELAAAWKAAADAAAAPPEIASSPALAANLSKPATKGKTMTKASNGGKKTRLGALLESAEEEKMSAEDILAQIRALVEEEADAQTDEDEVDAEADEDEASAEADDEASSETGEEKAAASAPSAKTVLAIMGLPEAQKNVALATDIAGIPGMTVSRAKSLLSKAGIKGFPGGVPDPDVKADGGSSNAATEIDRMADQAVALAGVGARVSK